MNRLSREVPIDPAHAALLNIDVQNYCTGAKAGKSEYFRRSLQDVVLPNIRRLQSFCRTARIEVVYSVIENMTRDGRDNSLDYKIAGSDVPQIQGCPSGRRNRSDRRRDDLLKDVELRLHLDQYRLRIAQSRRTIADRRRDNDGPVRRERSPRRVRSRLSRYPRDGCLHHRQRRSPRAVAARHL